MKTFALNPNTLITYMMHLEDHYPQNPYHNRVHAADVAQMLHVMLGSEALVVSNGGRRVIKVERIYSQSQVGGT